MSNIKITAADVEVTNDGKVIIRNEEFTELAKNDIEVAANFINTDVSNITINDDGSIEVIDGNLDTTIKDLNIWCDHC